MRRTPLELVRLAGLLLLLAAAAPAPAGSGRVENFGLLDHQGVFHELQRESQRPAIVLFVQGNGCPIARKTVPALRAVRDAFAPKGVVFWMINASPQDDAAEIAAEAEQFGIDFPILLDEAQLVARSLGVTRTAEAIVIAPDGWRIVYRGPVDDRLSYASERPPHEHWLRDALEAQLAGRPVATPVREAPGCLIRFDDAAAPPPSAISYVGDVAPILEQRCRTCHRAGGIAPWQMNDYATVRAWAPMMREVLRTGRMPPWQADPRYGHFADTLALPTPERRLLVRWIEAGAARGTGGDPLAEHPAPRLPEWPLGRPDVVVEASAQHIPASGVVPYLYEELELPFDREVWLRGVDLRPSNAAVMHHGLTWFLYPEGEKAPRTEGPRFTRGMLPGYVPGLRRAYLFPEGTGYRIPAGAKVRLQLHYTTTGRPETDVPRLALYLADGPQRHEVRVGAVGTLELAIPPGAEDYEVVTERVLERDIVVYWLKPHMHYRGKRMRYDAHYPDGRVETLLSVPRYDFNWQHQYAPDPPLRLPAGTRLVVTAAFDNSARNPWNPDPAAWVHWGEQSFDEMLFGFFLYREDGPLRTAGSSGRD